MKFPRHKKEVQDRHFPSTQNTKYHYEIIKRINVKENIRYASYGRVTGGYGGQYFYPNASNLVNRPELRR